APVTDGRTMPPPGLRRKWIFQAGLSPPCSAPMNVSHYPVHPGLFAGEHPGSPHPNLAGTRLRQLVAQGVRTFVDLTSRADIAAGLTPYQAHLAGLGEGSLDLRRHSFEIPDRDIPSSPALMRDILDLLRAEIDS